MGEAGVEWTVIGYPLAGFRPESRPGLNRATGENARWRHRPL
jgi:hypothetical protein